MFRENVQRLEKDFGLVWWEVLPIFLVYKMTPQSGSLNLPLYHHFGWVATSPPQENYSSQEIVFSLTCRFDNGLLSCLLCAC